MWTVSSALAGEVFVQKFSFHFGEKTSGKPEAEKTKEGNYKKRKEKKKQLTRKKKKKTTCKKKWRDGKES